MSVATVMLAVSVFVYIGIRRGGTDNPYNHDDERAGVAGYDAPAAGVWHYLIWLLGLLGLTALTGFFIALNVFFVAFLRREAKVSWRRTVTLTLAADLVLMFLSWLMTLDLPWGWLQHEFVDLPWPIGSI